MTCDEQIYTYRKAKAYENKVILTRASTDGTVVSAKMSPEEAAGLADCLTYGGGFLSEDGSVEVKATFSDMDEDCVWTYEMIWNDGRNFVDMVPGEDSLDTWATDLADELADAAREAESYEALALQGSIGDAEVDDKPSPAVDHPSHYRKDSGYEAIDVIEAWDLGFCLGNALKYICRAGLKQDAVEDLEKARWYLDREIERRRRK